MAGAPVYSDAVDCAEEHRIQMTERVRGPGGDSYPSKAEWDDARDGDCTEAAERFLGVPLDPYGRFVAASIVPLRDGWDQGDRDVWCGIAVAADESDYELFRGDVRGADPSFQFEPGTCLAVPPATESMSVVDCGEPHQREIVARLDLGDQAAMPSADEQRRTLHPRCLDAARTYLGSDPVPPWQTGFDEMQPESWAAGSRAIHCFLGQWGEDGKLLVVEGSAPR